MKPILPVELSTLPIIADNSTDLWCVINGNFIPIYLNDSFHKLLGYSKSKIIKDPLVTFEQEYKKYVIEFLIEVVSSGRQSVSNFITKHVNQKTKQVVWVNSTLTLKYDNGQLSYGIMVGRDVTDEIFEKEEITKMKQVLDQSELLAEMGSWVYHVELDKHEWTEGNRRLFEVDNLQDISTFNDFLDFVYLNDRYIILNLLEKIKKGDQKSQIIEFRVLGKITGRIKYLRTFVMPHFQSGKLVKIHGASQNITRLITEQKARKEKEQLYESLVENVFMGVSIIKNSSWVYANQTLVNLLGFDDFEEFRNVNPNDLIHPETYHYFQKWESNSDKVNIPFNYIGKFITKSKQIKIFEVQTRYLNFGDENFRLSVLHDVTEFVSTQKRLEETNKAFQLAQRFAHIGAWKWTMESGEIFWAESVYEIFDFKIDQDEVSYDSFLKAIHPDDRQLVVDAIQRCMRETVAYEVNHRVIRKDGSVIWVEERGNVIRDDAGNPVEMYGTVRNITEEKQLKEALKINQERYQLLAESGQDVIALYYPDCRVFYCSPSVEALLGYNPIDLIDNSFLPFIHPTEIELIKSTITSACNNLGQTFTCRLRMQAANGEYIWVEKSIKAILNEDESVIIRSLTRDISEQVQYEEQLIYSNKRLEESIKNYLSVNGRLGEALKELEEKSILLTNTNKYLTSSRLILEKTNNELVLKNEALNQMAILVESDSEGRITNVNTKFLELTGYTFKEVLGQPHCILSSSIFYSGFHDELFFTNLWDTLRSGKIWKGEICNKAKDGTCFWLLKTVIPIFGKSKEVESFFSFSNDITAQKQKELELEKARNEAEQSSLAREEFLSVMSHEIRTPLNSVIGLTNLLMRRDPREDQVPIIGTLKRSSDNLLHLVNDILDFNKIQLGKVEIEEIDFNLFEVMQQLQNSFVEMANEKGIDLKVIMDSSVPHLLVGDVGRLYQILNNLLHNAVKFTSTGGVTLNCVLVKIKKNSVKLNFIVEDTGIGIASEQKVKLFSPFHQAERHISRSFGGTGLGLSIVHGLVQLLGGKIHVESELKKGSIFQFEIDFKVNFNHNRLKSDLTFKNHRLAGLKILYVEDVESNQFLVSEFLSDLGVECKVASNGVEAINLAQLVSFDLILMDLQLPGMNGYEITNEIRNCKGSLNIKTPILAFTAEPFSPELKTRLRQSGMVDVIHKPFKFEALQNQIFKIANSFSPNMNGEFTLDFYLNSFGDNLEKFQQIKQLLAEDFNRLQNSLRQWKKDSDLSKLRPEIHRIYPIISNIEHYQLKALMDEIRKEGESFTSVANQVNMAIDFVAKILNSIDETI